MDTVSYSMPPDGYTTVTLPTELVDRIDGIVGYESRTAAIRALLDTCDVSEKDNWPSDGVGDLDELKSSMRTVEERTGRIERQLDELGGGR